MTEDEARSMIKSWDHTLETQIKKLAGVFCRLPLDYEYANPVKNPEFIFKIGEHALIVGAVLDDAPDLSVLQRFKPTIIVTERNVVKRNGFGHQQLYGARKGGDGFKLPNFAKAVAAAIRREETQNPEVSRDEKRPKKVDVAVLPQLPKVMVLSKSPDGYVLHIGMVQVSHSQVCAIASILSNESHRSSSSEDNQEDPFFG